VETRLISWNVNGIRALKKKGFDDWLRQTDADIVCLQETRVHDEQTARSLTEPAGYQVYWDYPERKGYSGVAIYAREAPIDVSRGFGVTQFDTEGRTLVARYRDFTLFNVYFPNGKMGPERLQYKLGFYDAFLEHILARHAAGERIVVCGDFNTAHREIDLAHPKQNARVSGFLPEEREWMDRLVSSGFVDTFRHFNGEPGNYTWWDMKTGARSRNVGWRLDYFFVSDDLVNSLVTASILREVPGSDHCPVGLTLAAP
jgi:exodeoxyribonuclease-3